MGYDIEREVGQLTCLIKKNGPIMHAPNRKFILEKKKFEG